MSFLDVNFLITQNEVAETLSCHDVSKLYFLILVVLFYLLYHNILRYRYIFCGINIPIRTFTFHEYFHAWYLWFHKAFNFHINSAMLSFNDPKSFTRTYKAWSVPLKLNSLHSYGVAREYGSPRSQFAASGYQLTKCSKPSHSCNPLICIIASLSGM